MALPGLIKQEGVLEVRVTVQDRRVIHRLVLHRIEDMMQPLEKLRAPLRHDLELDHIGDGHHRPHAGKN
jgi:hypothetical protein